MAIFRRGILALQTCCFAVICAPAVYAQQSPAQPQQLPLMDIQVTGTVRFSAAAVAAAANLKPGEPVGPKDFDAAIQRLGETGLFQSINYRYQSKTVGEKTGYSVTFQVQDAPVARAVRLDFAGLEEPQIWREIQRENGLIQPQIPSSADAETYYADAIRAALKTLKHPQEITTRSEGDLTSTKNTLVFYAANAPKIAGVSFQGSAVISGKTLESVIKRADFLGQPYSPSYVRLLLDQNIRPLYEERGYLTVRFPSVGITEGGGGAVVAVEVEEGQPWTLGAVDLTGDALPAAAMLKTAKFPEGKLANWLQVMAGLDAAMALVRNDGYLGAKSEVKRSYHQDSHVVDLAITVTKGRQFVFGKLDLKGLSPADEAKARAMWMLAGGSPMNPHYVDEYLMAIMKRFHPKGVSQQMQPGAGSNVVDLSLTLR